MKATHNSRRLIVRFLALACGLTPAVTGFALEESKDTAPAGTAERKTVQVRDAATHKNLVNTFRTQQQNNPLSKWEPAPAGKEDPAKTSLPKDIVSNSDILCYRGAATLVPRQAILHVPDNLAERVKMEEGARIQTWLDFFGKNRGWIVTKEVTLEQAAGKTPLPEGVIEQMKRSTKLVVATFKGGPVSVLPPKQDDSAQTEENTATARN